MAEVKLHGFWPSPFVHRVVWALKIKGVDYEYIEEEIPNNKSEQLLKYNPVYKKVPVLVHGGKPIAESLIILEYIDETWPENPLLPTDPYERAIARFWNQYIVDKGFPIFSELLFSTAGEAQEKAAKEFSEVLKTVEEKALGDKKFFGGDTINFLDISYGLMAYWFKTMEEVIGVEVLDPNTLPRFCQWAENFLQVPVIKENIPDHDKLFAYIIGIRKNKLDAQPNK